MKLSYRFAIVVEIILHGTPFCGCLRAVNASDEYGVNAGAGPIHEPEFPPCQSPTWRLLVPLDSFPLVPDHSGTVTTRCIALPINEEQTGARKERDGLYLLLSVDRPYNSVHLMIRRLIAGTASAFLLSALAPAQIRLMDRAQHQPQPALPLPQRGFQGRDFKIGRHPGNKNAPFIPGQGLMVPHWTSSFKYQGDSFVTTVVGTDPALGQTTVIPTVIIPYRLIFADGTVFDASTDLVDGVTPVNGVLNSPLFQTVPWNAGPTQLGTTQFGDAIQRADFWSIHSDQGQGYHVLLSTPTVVPVVVINVPADQGFTKLDASNKRFGVVDFQWMVDLTVNATTALGINPQTLPIHLFSYVAAEDLGGSVASGFHYAVNISGDPAAPVLQTLIQAAYYSTSSYFAADGSEIQAANTGVLAHEIAEWLNDPSVDNIIPAWQDPAFPNICDNPLMEVGDPLEIVSHGFQVTLGGRSYSFPDIAFQPWFTRSQNSMSANGWFSFLNTFPTFSTACPVFTNYSYGSFDFIGVDSTVLTGINNNKQVVGYVTLGSGLSSVLVDNFDPIHGSSVTVSLVSVPGSLVTVASKVNDAGNIVGGYADSKFAVHGFLFSNGQYTTIDFPGAIATEALGINNKNNFDIVGDYTDAHGIVHGFLLSGKSFSTINAPFAVNTAVYAINDKQKIAGVYDTGGPVTGGFAGTLGTISPLSYPNSPFPGTQTTSTVYSLNNADEIVGMEATFFSTTNFTQTKGFLEGGGNFEPSSIGVNDALFTQFLSNNDLGIVVGSFDDLAGNHGLFAVPAPLFSNLPFFSMKVALP